MNTQILQRALFLVLTIPFLNVAAIEKPVSLYGLFETEIKRNTKYTNPFDYTEISFSAELISPDLDSFIVSSFYDGRDTNGENLWKLRFMPHKPGLWKYRIKNNLGATVQSGNFTVTDQTAHPGNRGHVKVDTRHPQFLVYDDGTPHYWIGGKWISARDYGPESKAGLLNKGFDNRVNLTYGYKTDQQLVNYLDQLVQYKHNGILLKIAQYPLENDRLSWDLNWIRRGEWIVKEALNRGIYVQINLFDTWSRDKNQYFKHSMPGAGQLFDVWSDGDDKFKMNYLRYIISRFSSFANVYWELGNEMGHSPNCGPCFVKLANEKYLPWIRQFDPYQLPIGLSEGEWRSSSVDIGFLHQANELPDDSMKRPVIMNELVRYSLNQSFIQKVWRKLFGERLHTGLWHNDAIDNIDLRFTYRRTFWKVFTRGGSGSSEATWLDISKNLSHNVLNVMHDHMHLSRLINKLGPAINKMTPIKNYISSKNANENITSRGNESFIVSYFDAGYGQRMKAEVIRIKTLVTDYSAFWIDPSSGEVLSEKQLRQGSGELERPEYTQDLVLLLKR